MEKFEQGLRHHGTHNLSIQGASNFLIRLQIERAMQQQADFIIVNFTSSVREEGRYRDTVCSGELLDRFYRYHLDHGRSDLMAYSPWHVDTNPVLTADQKQLIRHYSAEFTDIDLNVAKNYFLITGTLDRLIKSGTAFLFSPGGFEHTSYLHDRVSGYDFDEYQAWRSDHNLWDHIRDFTRARPYFHIDDPMITQTIADYYLTKVEP